MSSPPKPPGASDEKNNQFPSGEIIAAISLLSVLTVNPNLSALWKFFLSLVEINRSSIPY
jgi:hypothetical protein